MPKISHRRRSARIRPYVFRMSALLRFQLPELSGLPRLPWEVR
ncbi:hypothetical protein [Streptomonospora litoralis]|uniref:Uncharacterized protein n=1 Tax=Streptomonospora litoralis TaxID=2498135 RepID=A0A4P6PZF5_9ACTN|nr:hypothetical protein [Streptomonospora litoralis]QBI53575.1 hypothetical protein EKD16_08905 [Streptomonospora litoralis]